MLYFLRYNTFFLFSNIEHVRIQSLWNPFGKFHCKTNPPSFLFKYLQSSLGFSPERALTLSQKIKGNKPRNPDYVLTFFESHGFSETHIKSIINRVPQFLFSVSPESSLRPKMQFFKDKGSSESDIVDVMVANPYLFTYSLEGRIKPVFNLLRSILGTDEFVVQFLIRSKLIFNPDALSTNMTILRSCGVQNHHILKLFMTSPQARALGANSDRFNEVVEMVKGIGFERRSNSFLRAVLTIVGLSRHKWEAKFKVYTSLGWPAEEILSIFCKQPACMSLSEQKIRKAFDYLTKELGWSPPYISIHPALLLLSLEKRVIPRHRFLHFLASKGFIKEDKIPAKSFLASEKFFLKNFVVRYESEVPDILKIYEGVIGSKLLNIGEGEGCNVQ